eukprot:3580898-Pyramimonas_sp.AAC.1
MILREVLRSHPSCPWRVRQARGRLLPTLCRCARLPNFSRAARSMGPNFSSPTTSLWQAF